MYRGVMKALYIVGICLGIWIGAGFLLPVFFPFLLGGALALAAEPMVSFLSRRLRRGAAAGIGVTAAFCLLVLLVLLVCTLLLRELAVLVRILPTLEQTAADGMDALSRWALNLAAALPGGIGEVLRRSIAGFFSGSSQLLEQAFRYALSLTGGMLSRVPGSAIVIATAVISSYMISVRLPTIRSWITARLSRERIRKFLDGLRRLKTAIFAWIRAQLKLMGITFLILTMGLVLLRVPYAPVWAAVVALVDILPVLGTGTVLLPWALVSFLQADTVRAVGLLSVYAVISLTRSIMEPKLVGSQLGLDPLATLAALYAGYKLWGFGGMILAPVLAVAAVQLLKDPGT